MKKGSQLNKESGVLNEQVVPAHQGVKGLKWTRGPSSTSSQGSQVNKGSQLNRVSGVSNEQGVPAEQGVRGLK